MAKSKRWLQRQWLKETRKGSGKWNRNTKGKGEAVCGGIAEKLDFISKADCKIADDYDEGVADVSAEDFENEITGRKAKLFADNYEYGVTH